MTTATKTRMMARKTSEVADSVDFEFPDLRVKVTAKEFLNGAREVEAVTQTREVEGSLRVHVRGASSVLPAIVTSADRAGFRVRDLSVTEPTLETVFINLTGRELRD